MQKSEFVTQIADKTGLTKKDVVAAVEAYHETVIEALKKGESVPLKGFGTYTTTVRKARTGRNPQTKEPMEIPASISPCFKPSRCVKDALNVNNERSEK